MANAPALSKPLGRSGSGRWTDERGITFTPLDETLGIITPSALHFENHRGGVPDIDPRKHLLLIHGLVDRPVTLTMEEIKRLPSTSRILFLECAGNSRIGVACARGGADCPVHARR